MSIAVKDDNIIIPYFYEMCELFLLFVLFMFERVGVSPKTITIRNRIEEEGIFYRLEG